MKTQRGNALFLILIAVALFAALSYAITQSGRGTGTIDREEAVLAAAQLTQFAGAIRTTVTRMILTGTPMKSICFGNQAPGYCTVPELDVFDPAGGNMLYQCPGDDKTWGREPGPIMTNWNFRNIRNADNRGWYIKDVGTNTNVAGRDSFAFLGTLKLSVCQQINKQLGIATTPVAVSAWSVGIPAVTYIIGDNVIDSNPGQPFACMSDGSYDYTYYHALIEQ